MMRSRVPGTIPESSSVYRIFPVRRKAAYWPGAKVRREERHQEWRQGQPADCRRGHRPDNSPPFFRQYRFTEVAEGAFPTVSCFRTVPQPANRNKQDYGNNPGDRCRDGGRGIRHIADPSGCSSSLHQFGMRLYAHQNTKSKQHCHH